MTQEESERYTLEELGFEDGGRDHESRKVGMWVASKSWEQPSDDSQQENRDLSTTAARNYILPIS